MGVTPSNPLVKPWYGRAESRWSEPFTLVTLVRPEKLFSIGDLEGAGVGRDAYIRERFSAAFTRVTRGRPGVLPGRDTFFARVGTRVFTEAYRGART